MNAGRQALQSAEALTHRTVCKVLGEVVSYVNRGATAVPLYAEPVDADTLSLGTYSNMSTETTRKTWRIARQTGFPPTYGPATGDGITDEDSKVYRVVNFELD